MNILQVIPYFAPAWAYGGPVRVCYDICLELARRGHQITVYTTDSMGSHRLGKANLDDVTSRMSVRYFRNMSNWLAFRHHLFISPGLIATARKEVKKFDIIHLHEYRTFQSWVLHHYAQTYNVPYILHAHGSMPRRLQKKGMKTIYDCLVGNRILRDASRVIALTPKEKRQYLDFKVEESKIELLPYGISLPDKSNIPPRGEFRRAYSLGENDKVILFVGRISRIKGLDMLLDVFKDLVSRLQGMRLAIVGPDDDYLEVLKDQVSRYGLKSHVIFTGLLEGKSKLSAFIDSDIFVLPSYDEGLSAATLEACALGLPVVLSEAARIQGIEEYKAGLIFRKGDREELINHLLALITNEAVRRTLGENAKKLVADQFTLSKQVGKLQQVYEGCITKTS